jgi:hypothetical protein
MLDYQKDMNLKEKPMDLRKVRLQMVRGSEFSWDNWMEAMLEYV